MPVTDAVRRLAAVVIYQLSVNAMPLTVSPVTERESSSMSRAPSSVKFAVFSLKSLSLSLYIHICNFIIASTETDRSNLIYYRRSKLVL